MIRWEEKYATGVKEIDHQHQWLFDFVNNLELELIERKKPSIDHILKSMEAYAKKHFQYEEHCMHRWQCPVASENKTAHQNFIDAYENFMERYDREGHSEELAWKIHNMFEKWIADHICRIDVHLRTCHKNLQESSSEINR